MASLLQKMLPVSLGDGDLTLKPINFKNSLPPDRLAQMFMDQTQTPSNDSLELNNVNNKHNGVRALDENSQKPLTRNPAFNCDKNLKIQFVQSIRRGDIKEVRASMEMLRGLHRLEDFYGCSALEHAVASGKVEMVEHFLDQSETLTEKQQSTEHAILYAIKDNHLPMVDRLITISNEIKEQEQSNQSPAGLQITSLPLGARAKRYLHTQLSLEMINDAEFSQDIKPMVLAAQLNRPEIIELLHDRCTPSIHPLTLPCSTKGRRCCLIRDNQVDKVGQETIEDCWRSLDVYKALSSPAYLLHKGGHDPLLEAFVISDRMDKDCIVKPAYHMELSAISQRCKTFATSLLGLCRSVEEVKTMFGATHGIEMTHRPSFHVARFPRLLLAIHFNQKQFIAHPHCQQVMENQWYSGLPKWVCKLKYHNLRLFIYVLFLFIFMPFLMLLCSFRVKPIEQFVKSGANKFILDACSLTYFLIMLFVKEYSDVTPNPGVPFSALDWLISIWVLGMVVRFVKMNIGRKDCGNCSWLTAENSNWRSFELISLVCFIIQYTVLIVHWVMLSFNGRGFKNVDIVHLPANDLYLLSEIFRGIGSCLAVTQLFPYFKVDSTLGPLQVSLKKMFSDVLKLMIVFLVILTAFAIGISSLYSKYHDVRVYDVKSAKMITQNEAFKSLKDTYKRLFWDVFNYGKDDNADIVMSTSEGGPIMQNVNVTYQNATFAHRCVELVGYTMYSAYHITVIIVLLNMLISMMANSYNHIEANADTEWKFARTRLFMEYFNEVGVLCPPFNLIPFRPFLAFLRKGCCKVDQVDSTSNSTNTKELIDRLRKRYWKVQGAKQTSKAGSNEATGRLSTPTKNDLTNCPATANNQDYGSHHPNFPDSPTASLSTKQTTKF